MPRLRAHRVIGIDTSVFIYVFEMSPSYAQIASEVLRQLDPRVSLGLTSAVTLMEIVVLPLRQGNRDSAHMLESAVREMPNLRVVDIGHAAARRAAELRARFGVPPADALQIGACLQAGATAFVTNDKRLKTITELEVFVLDDFVH